MTGVYRDIFRSLAKRELLLPYFKNQVLANDWPMTYDIEVDSSPYYGFGDGYFHPSTHCGHHHLQPGRGPVPVLPVSPRVPRQAGLGPARRAGRDDSWRWAPRCTR